MTYLDFLAVCEYAKDNIDNAMREANPRPTKQELIDIEFHLKKAIKRLDQAKRYPERKGRR